MADADQVEADPLDVLIVGELANWAKGKSLLELEVIDQGGDTLFPDTIARIDVPNKRLVEHEIYLRVPGGFEMARARVDAMQFLAKMAGKPADTFVEETAKAYFGEQTFEHTENLFILEKSIRRRSDPTRQYMTAEMLDKSHPAPALVLTMEKLAAYRRMLDIRITEKEMKDPRVFWGVIAAIAKRGDLSPLVVIETQELNTFFTSMAVELQRFRIAALSPPSSESSTATASPSP